MRFDSISHETDRFALKTFSASKTAKRALLSWFNKLERGRLTLVDGDEVYTFGEEVVDDKFSSKVSASIHVHSQAFYSDIVFAGAVGSGESYMKGHWSSPDLVKAVQVLALNIQAMQSLNSTSAFARKMFYWLYSQFTKNSPVGSRKNIAAHYDLGNDFFELFLDSTMMYSAGVWERDSLSLEQASIAKLELICQKLQLTETDHVMEIGTGWGGFAIYAAKHYGCCVTTTTISREQFAYARERVKQEGLQDKVTLLLDDYRDLTGKYDKLVSIEMIEAVGHDFLPGFFQKCNALLKDDGIMLIQAITISDQRYQSARKSIDFIQRYIFPGGCLPCVSVFSEQVAQNTDMQIVDMHDITHDYALTLKHWRGNFFSQLQMVKAQGYNDVFIRMWDFYLSYCEGAFRERVIQTSQFLVTKAHYDYRARLLR